MGKYQYKAFISYSHADERWGRWLHRRLENYRLPTHLVGQENSKGKVPKRLKPIFRDRDELAAADNLGEKIEQALAQSESLIIICSPNAAKSHWVNQEILHFKHSNRSAQIFSVIIDGEPFASKTKGREHEECFPKALRYELASDGLLSDKPAEPLAADMRASGDGKRLGTLKLVSGMIGLGLDQLVQRDMQRRMRHVMAVTASAFIAMLVMAGMTMIAIKSRDEAQRQRAEAEGLVEYMLTDLRAEIKGSVGELPVMTAVNKRLMDYYSAQGDLAKLPADSLVLRARIIKSMGQDDQNRGDFELARQKYEELHRITAALLNEDPKNPDRLFIHAKSENRLGLAAHSIGDLDEALPHLEKAKVLLEKIPDGKRKKGKWAHLMSYVHANSCAATLKENKDASLALSHCQSAIIFNKQVIAEAPEEVNATYGLVFNYVWLSKAWEAIGNTAEASLARSEYIRLSDALVKKDGSNLFWREQQMEVYTHFADNLQTEGDTENARKYYAKALAISNTLIATDQDNDNWSQHHNQLVKNLEKGNKNYQ